MDDRGVTAICPCFGPQLTLPTLFMLGTWLVAAGYIITDRYWSGHLNSPLEPILLVNGAS